MSRVMTVSEGKVFYHTLSGSPLVWTPYSQLTLHKCFETVLGSVVVDKSKLPRPRQLTAQQGSARYPNALFQI